MEKSNNGRIWREFSSKMEQIPSSSKKLTDWIDYYLWQGGKYSEIEIKVKKKAEELSHKTGYKFPGNLFNRSGKPQDRTFLGHIAARVISEDLFIEIEGNPIDSSIEKLSLNEKAKKNDLIKNICKNSNPYIMIKPFKDEPLSDKEEGKLHIGNNPKEGYLPERIDAEQAYKALAQPGEEVDIDCLLDQIEKDCRAKDLVLDPRWREITEKNILDGWPAK